MKYRVTNNSSDMPSVIRHGGKIVYVLEEDEVADIEVPSSDQVPTVDDHVHITRMVPVEINKPLGSRAGDPVASYTLDGYLFRMYPTVSMAAEDMGCTPSQISIAARGFTYLGGRAMQAAGLFWRQSMDGWFPEVLPVDHMELAGLRRDSMIENYDEAGFLIGFSEKKYQKAA